MSIAAGSPILVTDVSSVGNGIAVAGKLIETDSNGLLDKGFLPVSVLPTLTAGANLSAGDAVAMKPFQSDGGVLLDAKFNGVPGSNTKSFTVGANSNRILVVFVFIDNSHSISNAAYAGVNMTQVDTFTLTSNMNCYSFVLIAPATGTNNLVFTTSGTTIESVAIYSYYNAKQSAQPDSHAASTGGNNSFSYSITPVSNGSLIASAVVASGSGAPSFVSSTGMQNNTGQSNPSNQNLISGDSGQLFTLFPQTVSGTFTGGTLPTGSLSIGIAPFTAPTFQLVQANASSSVTANTFIGFAPSAISSAASGLIQVSGVVSGLSGLIAGGQYYLSNVAGGISTVPGTVTRKVGIALSATTLLITNNW